MKARSLDIMRCHLSRYARLYGEIFNERYARLRGEIFNAMTRRGIMPPIRNSQVAFAECVAFYQFCWTLLDRSRG